MDDHALGFSGEEDDHEDDDSEFVYYPFARNIRVKDPPPKFNGNSTKFIEWSKNFLRCSIRWGFNRAHSSQTELDVSHHLEGTEIT